MIAKGKPISRDLVFTAEQVTRTDAILTALDEKSNPIASLFLDVLADCSPGDLRERARRTAIMHAYCSALVSSLEAAVESEVHFLAVLAKIKNIKSSQPRRYVPIPTTEPTLT